MDSLLAKGDTISDAAGLSAITYLRQGKKCCTAAVRERSEKNCGRNNLADTKVTEEGGAEGAPGFGAKIPLQPVEKTMVKQIVPTQNTNDHVGEDIHPAAHGRPHTRA
ncbi:protein pxr1-like [Limosa lapponica baueri]|uniref:Protein pxr1-like n=1 Tax=Limosa lapponica baueri TaxID=1758121 RepID=A0A2I0U2B5_LIMLA|nr:protein pxr1-like [Limosa lapponica baueri]